MRKPLPFSLLVLGEAMGLAHLVQIFHSRRASHDGRQGDRANGVASELDAEETETILKQKDEHMPAQKEPVLEYDEELDPTRPITFARLC